MDLAFETKALRETCLSEKTATQKFGAKAATMLKHRLADLRAAASIGDLPPGLISTKGAQGAVDLPKGLQLIFVSNHPDASNKKAAIDWPRVRRIKILKLDTTS